MSTYKEHMEALYLAHPDSTEGLVDLAGALTLAASADAEIAKLRAAAPTWRPIDEAPKDGSMFLCWVAAVRYGETDEGRQYQHDASQIDFCWWRDGVDGNGYFDPACGQIGDAQDVTHWMPLPAAPAIDAQLNWARKGTE